MLKLELVPFFETFNEQFFSNIGSQEGNLLKKILRLYVKHDFDVNSLTHMLTAKQTVKV